MTTLSAPPERDRASGVLGTHQLRPDVVKLTQGIVVGLATSAPGQATAVAMASMVSVAAYATGPAILIGMLPMLAIALCYQRLNFFDQNCGGPYVWVGRAIHPALGYFVAWSMVVGFVLGSVSNVLPLGPSLLGLFGLNSQSQLGNVISATLFGLAMTAIAATGIKLTVRFQVLIAAIEYAILLVFSVIGFWAVFIRHWPGTVHPSLSWLSLSGIGGKGSLSGAMLISIFLYIGWDAPMYLNEESERKATNPGRAVLIAVAILGPLYAWLFISLQGVVSPAALQSHAAEALPFIAKALVGAGFAKLMVLAILLSVLGTTQATIVATSRVTYAMGTDALLPRAFGRVSRRLGTPLFATLFWGAMTVVIADLYVLSSSLAGAFNNVVNAAAIAFAVFWIFTALATTWYYRLLLKASLLDLLLVGVLPLGAAAVLIWILTKQIPTLGLSARWTVAGVGALGLALMAFSAFVLHAPFFSLARAAYRPETNESPPRS